MTSTASVRSAPMRVDAGHGGQQRDGGEDGDHGDVLHQQDGKAGAAGIGLGDVALFDRLHGDGGRGHGQRQADDEGGGPVQAGQHAWQRSGWRRWRAAG